MRRPPGHWALLTCSLSVLVMLLAAQGLSVRSTGPSGTPSAGRGEPALPVDRSLLGPGEGGLRAISPPRRLVALSFDDGPDPRWTPRIAAELERLGVPATFFVVGANAVRHPGVVRELHRDGFELGNHTFTHSDLGALASWRRRLELSLTQSAVAAIAGVQPRLVRPPYSSTPGAATTSQLRTYRQTVANGYVIALSDLDGRDWSRPGVNRIVAAVNPGDGRSGSILLHDGGGDRSQTVTALGRIVLALRSRGYRFVRVSELAGLSRAQAEPAAPAGQRLGGHLLVASLAAARGVTTVMTWLVVAIALLALARAAVLASLAAVHVRAARRQVPDPSFAPAVSVIVPAFNEAVDIERTVQALVASDYPQMEIVVVDDGSQDGTGDLVEAMSLGDVTVLRQPNAGKAAALGLGLQETTHEVVVTVDADTLFERGTLRELVAPFREPGVGAVSGNTKVGNRSGLLGRWQHIEYVVGFNLDRRMLDVLRCMPTVPGAVGAFRRRALSDAGGFSAATLAEDTDVTLAIGRAGWRVVYAQRARAWTEAPSSIGALWRQRYRWSYGTMQAVWKHRGAARRRDQWQIGRIGLPYLALFQVALPLLAPLIDLLAIYGVVFLDPVPVLGSWLAFNLLQLALAAYALRLDGESLRVLWTLPLQQFVYRQLMYLVVIESVVSALLGTRLRWQHVERTGEARVPA